MSLKFLYFCLRQPCFFSVSCQSVSDTLVWARPKLLSPRYYLNQSPHFSKILIAHTISKLVETLNLRHNHSILSYFVAYNLVRTGLGDYSIFYRHISWSHILALTYQILLNTNRILINKIHERVLSLNSEIDSIPFNELPS